MEKMEQAASRAGRPEAASRDRRRLRGADRAEAPVTPPGREAEDAPVVHFVGIGGIGMSGIAEVLLNLGFRVRGSDLKAGETVARLEKLGADVRIGHAASTAKAWTWW
jgi:hypothetical protein